MHTILLEVFAGFCLAILTSRSHERGAEFVARVLISYLFVAAFVAATH